LSDVVDMPFAEPYDGLPYHGALPTNKSRMKKLILVAPGGRIVCDVCHLADKPHTRLRGIMGWKHLRQGEGVLLRPTFSVHTAFVRFPIDAVFLDREMTVVSITHELKPWRLASARKARSVLELAAGECRRLGLEPGDRIGWGLI
jgi:uncharacterized membrane protein (UPF0127 family)